MKHVCYFCISLLLNNDNEKERLFKKRYEDILLVAGWSCLA